ncbi:MULTISPECIES: ricin-type beta-trefoil lectin domain protein [unclassified Micromonospora]|uniref:poly(ethylene terephthalate) hydrolase family protein n=1 Tax=Micromonospora TaxID=1873 RepID=UPI002417F8E6|nr:MULTISPECIES: ricin-type beta-trefoil lectin domain protein [unclassified Micromonospora]MDG4816930.1 ricin-type beta-trefoil lectin domain protein [Micromonospora sp. WMMD956]WFE59429.1 ricin-type beta-trefoil lectin domain protein [Micromonospora sp. WMMD712]
MPPGLRGRLAKLAAAGIAAAVGLFTIAVATGSASAADNPYQRGPDPTRASVASENGPFANTSVAVPTGYGFNGGRIYYPTDTSQGTFGAIAISPGYTALFSVELAWMGPWLASHGFVVIGIETNSRNDFDTARGTQLLAALDYLTQQSPVRDRVDASRLAVAGHSMGGGGALSAAMRRSSLKAAVGIAPYSPSSNLATDRVPTMVFSGQADTVVTPSYATGLYNSLPTTTESAYLEVAGADHGFMVGRSNPVLIRTMLPFLKIFIDNDARYSQFLCPLLDSSGVVTYRSTCPLLPTPPTSPTATPTTTPTTPPPTSPPGAASQIVGAQSGRCVDVPNASRANGTRVQLYDCNRQSNQSWTYTSTKQLRVYGDMCLDAAGSGNGAAVQIYGCHSQTNQQWNVNSNGTISSVQSGRCLDVWSTANGAQIQLYDCHGQTNQRFSLTPLA